MLVKYVSHLLLNNRMSRENIRANAPKIAITPTVVVAQSEGHTNIVPSCSAHDVLVPAES